MGIKGLLRFLKPTSKVVYVPERYAHRRLGIDMLCLLHRGAMSDPMLVMGGTVSGHRTVARFVERKIQVLIKRGIQPICVFDGDPLPAKMAENSMRREMRQEARSQTETALKDGASKADVYGMACRSVSISSELIRYVIQLCIENRWPHIVAPFEADAQLAYLCRIGYIDAVISEDSDLLAYGCPRVLTKMTGDGEAVEFDLSKTFGLPDLSIGTRGISQHQPDVGKTTQQLRSVLNPEFTYKRFLAMCILSNCDYIETRDHIPGMGLATSAKLLFKHKSLKGVLDVVKKDSKTRSKIDENAMDLESIERAHYNAELTFLNHWVYCPIQNAVIAIHSATCRTSQYPLVLDELRHNIQTWTDSFQGCVLEDKENYDAAVLGHCIQRSSDEWKSKLFGKNAAEEVMARMPSTCSPSLPPSINSDSTPIDARNQSQGCDLRSLLNWKPVPPKQQVDGPKRKSSFSRRRVIAPYDTT